MFDFTGGSFATDASEALKTTIRDEKLTIINHFFNRCSEIEAAGSHSTTLLAVYASKQKEQNGSLCRPNLWVKGTKLFKLPACIQ